MTRHPEPPAPLPFSRPLDLSRQNRGAPAPLTHRAGEAEAAAIARFLKVDAVEGFAFDGSLVAWEAKGWRIEGRLRARLTQPCIVTLEPVTQEIDLEIDRRYLPRSACTPDSPEADFDPEEENAPDPHDGTIDLAEPLMEALALALEPYPRAPGAHLGARVFAPPGVEPLTDEAMRPFARLAALRARDGDEGGAG